MTDLYNGDILIQQNTTLSSDDYGSFDMEFVNGQPVMTKGLDTCVLISVFGSKHTWQNGIAKKEAEKYISDFPDIVERGTVSEKTKNDGIQAIKKALNFLKTIKAAKNITVTGEIINVFAIGWGIEITRPDGSASRYGIGYNYRNNKWDLNWKSYE